MCPTCPTGPNLIAFLHKFYFALEVSFSIYYSFNSNEYNWYTLKGAYFKKQEVGSLILKPFPNRRYS